MSNLHKNISKVIREACIKQEAFNIVGKIQKINEDKQLVYGFASVIEQGGEKVVDFHDDVIEEDDLIKAAHTFMREYRTGKIMHRGTEAGRIVESIVFTKDIQKALGIDLDLVGWFIGYKVDDPDIFKKVKEGQLKMFSIGGMALKEPLDE